MVKGEKYFKVIDVITIIKELEIDGETMQSILREVGMDDQMLRQLMMTMPWVSVEALYEERKNFRQTKYGK